MQQFHAATGRVAEWDKTCVFQRAILTGLRCSFSYGRQRQGHYILLLQFIFLFFFYVGRIDERPAMGSQPNLASRSEVVSIYKCLPQIFLGPSAKFGAQKHQIMDRFSATSALNNAYLRNETSHRETEMLVSIYSVSSKSCTFRDVTFDPETAEIRFLIATHPSAAITLQPSKLRHLWFYSLLIVTVFILFLF